MSAKSSSRSLHPACMMEEVEWSVTDPPSKAAVARGLHALQGDEGSLSTLQVRPRHCRQHFPSLLTSPKLSTRLLGSILQAFCLPLLSVLK